MRSLFETGKMKEARFFSDNEIKGDVRVTMTSNKCFEIRQYNKDMNYWCGVFETSSKCDWNAVTRYVDSLIN